MRGESHLREHGAAQKPVGICKRFQHFEMIVALADDELDRLAGGLHRGEEIARLTLEFRRLVGAVGKDERSVKVVDMALGAQRCFHFIGELDVFRTLR